MAVPKRRTSKQRKRKRRSHLSKTPRELQSCPQCGVATPSHVICSACGHYMGRKLVDTDD